MQLKCKQCNNSNLRLEGKVKLIKNGESSTHNIYYCHYCYGIRPVYNEEIDEYLQNKFILDNIEGYDFEPIQDSQQDIKNDLNRLADYISQISSVNTEKKWSIDSIQGSLQNIATTLNNIQTVFTELKEEKKNNKFGLLSSSSFDLR